VGSNGRGTDGPQVTNAIRQDAAVSLLVHGETQARVEE